MSRRSRTTLSIEIRFPLPPGANTAMATEWIRTAIMEKKETDLSLAPSKPMASLQTNEMIVKLKEKKTIYL